jgi:hypothetical protein
MSKTPERIDELRGRCTELLEEIRRLQAMTSLAASEHRRLEGHRRALAGHRAEIERLLPVYQRELEEKPARRAFEAAAEIVRLYARGMQLSGRAFCSAGDLGALADSIERAGVSGRQG